MQTAIRIHLRGFLIAKEDGTNSYELTHAETGSYGCCNPPNSFLLLVQGLIVQSWTKSTVVKLKN